MTNRTLNFEPGRRHFLALGMGAAAVLVLPDAVRAADRAADIRTLAFDGDTLLIAGATLRASLDNGRSWHERPTPSPVASIATHPARPGRLLAGLARGGVAVSGDGGSSWTTRSDGLASGEVTALAVAAGNPYMIYAAIRGDGLWKSEDAGATWALAMDRPWLDAAERDPLTLVSVDLETGMGGIWIYAGTEKGLTRVPDCFCRWQEVQPGNAMDALVTGDAPPAEAPLPTDEPVLSLANALAAPSTLYAALPSGVWASQDGGVVWTHKAKGQGRTVAVHPRDKNHVAAILDGALKLSRDGGATWTAIAVA
ncbi:hypothetical protein SAMN05443999_107194 [Roseovarius azorensis]|uniref:BNR/Asp-box repeat-containing protein n=1 Tax=Roseovarius azorensis TaxID=1287727 RepID=A0A1H7SP75_9RHOB|nr:sialidase family protein [Roseovarius azorensis]SEL74275.1 hypothetical protein SAMN05443999_107194 [Roseovarius azorensis]